MSNPVYNTRPMLTSYQRNLVVFGDNSYEEYRYANGKLVYVGKGKDAHINPDEWDRHEVEQCGNTEDWFYVDTYEQSYGKRIEPKLHLFMDLDTLRKGER